MADETKKYLVNIESNLKKYAEDAAATKVEIDKLTESNKALKKSGKDNTEEYEKNRAQITSLKKEYNSLTSSSDLLIRANKAQKGSYEQLYLLWQLAEKDLKKLGDGFVYAADGTRKLNDKFPAMSKASADAKKSLDQFGKATNDNRLNVGNYSGALEGLMDKFNMIPGPIGRVASSTQTFISTLAKIGPVGALIAGGIMAISAPLAAFFTKSEKGIELLEVKTAGFKASWNVLVGEMISGGDKMVEVFDKPEKKAKTFWTVLMGLISPAWMETGIRMDAAATSAEKFTEQLHILEDQERAMIVPRAEANLAIKEARLLYADNTKSIEVRLAALKKSLDLENETSENEIKHQQDVIANLRIINDEKKKAGMLRDSDEKLLQEAIAKEINLRTESAGKQVRAAKTYYTALAEMRKDDITLLKLNAEGNLKLMKEALKKELDLTLANKELTNTQKLILEKQYQNAVLELEKEFADKAVTGSDVKSGNKKDFAYDPEEEKKLIKQDIEDGFEYQRLKSEGNLDALDKILDQEYGALLASEEYQKASNNRKLLLDEQYNQAKKDLSNARVEQGMYEAGVMADLAGSMSNLVGKQTAVGKVFAVAEATINTYRAAIAVMAETKGGTIIRFAAMAAVIASGLANIRQILSVKIPGQSSSGSMPTSIASSAHAQTAAAPVGSTILNQPQLTQTQLNAMPNQNLLTAQDIANALSKLPPPVVTVEDINNRTNQVNKVTVRANI